MKKRLIFASIALVTGLTHAQELSTEQQGELLEIGVQHVQKASEFEGMMLEKVTELEKELTREGRLDSEENAKETAKNVNHILKDLGGLYGEYIQSRVAFMLEAKNVLTTEQKLHLLAQLDSAALLDDSAVESLQPGIFDLPINLDMKQRKKLINLEADLLIEAAKLERDTQLVLLDLEAIFMADTIEPAKVDKQVKKLATLAAAAINNRIEFFIEAKDVLTLDQKRMLSYLMGL